ncbi:hypothetical protein C7M84_005303 [Penaeus vannamei]|uniref:Uncharacterized protein n=1 Tax=Penaeus vannamei TaxID=6689 RepID=A0A423TI42_PENVA|nr:hypothetical protein C7M84_005303 [Penaeus vannamei]
MEDDDDVKADLPQFPFEAKTGARETPLAHHDCLPRVNSGDVSVVEERPGLCCALYNLCCFRETPRISPKRKNDGPPPSIPIVHRFSFPTSVSQQRAHSSPAPAARPPAPRDEQPREPPRNTNPNRPQLPRKLPGRPRDSDDDQDARPNFASGPRRPQLPRKLPFRPDDSEGPQPPRKLPNRPSDADRPQPNRPNSSDRPQFLSKPQSEPQTPRKPVPTRAEGLAGPQPARKIKVRPRPQQRNDVEPERAEPEELPAPVQTAEQEDRRGPSGVEEISADPEGETAPLPIPPAVERTPKIISGQVAEPAESVTPPPAISPEDIPTYLPIEIPQDSSAPPTPSGRGDVFEAPQLSPEVQTAPEPSEAPAGSPEPSLPSPQEPEEAQSPDLTDVPAPPAAATRGRGTRTRGRARGSRGRARSDTGAEEAASKRSRG